MPRNPYATPAKVPEAGIWNHAPGAVEPALPAELVVFVMLLHSTSTQFPRHRCVNGTDAVAGRKGATTTDVHVTAQRIVGQALRFAHCLYRQLSRRRSGRRASGRCLPAVRLPARRLQARDGRNRVSFRVVSHRPEVGSPVSWEAHAY